MGVQWSCAVSVERLFALVAGSAALFTHVQMDVDCDKLSWKMWPEARGPCEEAG